MMTKEQLAEIRARLAGAAPGPWRRVATEVDYGNGAPQTRHRVYAAGTTLDVCDDPYESDADFIAHAPEDVADMLAEIERGWAEIERWTAPVDVEAEVGNLLGAMRGVPPSCAAEVADVVRPLVTDRARLAREVEGLVGEVRTLGTWCDSVHTEAVEKGAEIARLTAVQGGPAIATHAEILGGDSRTIVATHEVRLDGETAIVAEQWTDGAEVVKRYEVRMRFAEFVHLALNTTPEERREVDARGDWRGVEPRADAVKADPCEPTVDVTAITHDFRPGAQDGMPPCPDLYVGTGGCEACGNAPGARHAWRCDGAAARPVAARDEVTDAELADAIECTSGEGPLAWPGSLLRRLALAEQARRAASAMTAERTREDLSQKIRGMSDEQKVELAPVFEEAMATRHAPTRALTEAEADVWTVKIWRRDSQTAIRDALLAASRGDVPPEVRLMPAADPLVRSDAGSDMTKREFIAHEARGIAATGRPVTARDPRTDPAPGDWLTDGRYDVAVDFVTSGGDVLARRFRVGEDELSSAAHIPLDVYRRDAASAEVLAVGLPARGKL